MGACSLGDAPALVDTGVWRWRGAWRFICTALVSRILAEGTITGKAAIDKEP